MPTTLKEFTKNRKYLLCVDSDGCVMDTMNIKHKLCFGPCFVDEWNLMSNRQQILTRWNDINLYEITRGINRFKGLAKILQELYADDTQVLEFVTWANGAKELSESALERVIANNSNSIFYKALNWSRAVNKAINQLSNDDKVAFDGSKNGLIAARNFFDIAIVSSANYSAVIEEWEHCELLQYTDVVATQMDGSKAQCIAELIQKGYNKQDVIMCGDAEGDLLAAKSNDVAFYPILVNKEKRSWEQLPKFINDFVFNMDALDKLVLCDAFYSNLAVKSK